MANPTYTPIIGTNGSITMPGGTPTPVEWVGTWSYSSEATTNTVGPFVNDTRVQTVATGREQSLELEFTVPKGGDTGMDMLIAAHHADPPTLVSPVFKATFGKIITFTNALVTACTIDLESESTQTGTMTITGPAAVTQDPVV